MFSCIKIHHTFFYASLLFASVLLLSESEQEIMKICSSSGEKLKPFFKDTIINTNFDISSEFDKNTNVIYNEEISEESFISIKQIKIDGHIFAIKRSKIAEKENPVSILSEIEILKKITNSGSNFTPQIYGCVYKGRINKKRINS